MGQNSHENQLSSVVAHGRTVVSIRESENQSTVTGFFSEKQGHFQEVINRNTGRIPVTTRRLLCLQTASKMDESMAAVAPDDANDSDHDDQQQHHHHHHPPVRTRSGMSEDEQRSRRESIKEIMADHSLSAVEKRRSIQSLMDGRRRSSTTGCSVSSGSAAEANPNDYVSSMAAAAAAAAEYYDSSDDDMLMSEGEDEDDENNLGGSRANNSLNPCDAVYVGRRASATASVSGDSSVSQISLGYGVTNRRGSATSSSGNNSHSILDQHNSNNTHDDSSSAIRNRELIQGLDDQDDDVKKRFRRYGRARSLQDFGDGAFAAAAAAASAFVKNDPRSINKRMEKSRPKCEHYERNFTVVSPCCGLAFGCRICHDECPVLPPPLSAKKQKQLYEEDVSESHHDEELENAACAAAVPAFPMEQVGKKTKADRRRSMPIDLEEEETHHEIDRFAIREVICRICYTRQTSKRYVWEDFFSNCIARWQKMLLTKLLILEIAA